MENIIEKEIDITTDYFESKEQIQKEIKPPESKSFHVAEGYRIATSDLSLIKDTKFLFEEITGIDHSRTWYYYSRLIVPLQMRRKGYAKKLLQMQREWLDLNGYCVWNDINPYGDLDLSALIRLYGGYGFVLVDRTVNQMIYTSPSTS
jgi:GNAT superfamily N-acetyltransferase